MVQCYMHLANTPCIIVILAFCPRSSNKTAQALLKDHMVSHYKKIYSAKGKLFGLNRYILYGIYCIIT